MLKVLTLNSVSWSLIGLFFIGVSIWQYRSYAPYPLVAGIFCIGIGCILCGITNGFSVYTHADRIMRKIGGLALIVGVPLTCYYMYMLYLR